MSFFFSEKPKYIPGTSYDYYNMCFSLSELPQNIPDMPQHVFYNAYLVVFIFRDTQKSFELLGIATGSRMNCRVTTVEGLPSSTGLNSSWQVFQRSIIGVPLSGVASSARQDTGNQSQHRCLHIPRIPTVTNSTDRRISSQHPQSALDE